MNSQIQSKTLSSTNVNHYEQDAWIELQALLTARISAAESGAVSNKSFKQITSEAIEKWKESN